MIKKEFVLTQEEFNLGIDMARKDETKRMQCLVEEQIEEVEKDREDFTKELKFGVG